MESSTTAPRLALVVNLGNKLATDADATRARHLVQLLDGHRLPATWVVGEAQQTLVLGERQSAAPPDELALSIGDHCSAPAVSPHRFQRELRRRLDAVAQLCGKEITAAMGDNRLLRARASMLAAHGVGTILSGHTDCAAPRPLACGLWSLSTRLKLPQTRRLARFLSRRPSSLLQVMGHDQGPTLIVVDAAELGRRHGRGVQRLDKWLRDISWAASRQQIEVVTTGQIVAELSRQNQVQPQRSILRVAA